MKIADLGRTSSNNFSMGSCWTTRFRNAPTHALRWGIQSSAQKQIENSESLSNMSNTSSQDTQGDRNMRDSEPEREDLESARFPTCNPTPQSDPLLSAPTRAHRLDLTPGPQRGVSFDARLEKPPKYGGKRDRDACKVWLNRMRMHLLSEQVLGGVTYREGQKVVLASSFLEKEALHWHVLYFIQAVYPEQTQHVTTFEDWAALLQRRFQDVRTQETRRDEWDSLKQTGTAANFAQRIESDALHLTTAPTSADMLLLFKRGLKPATRARIESLPDDFLPKFSGQNHKIAVFQPANSIHLASCGGQ